MTKDLDWELLQSEVCTSKFLPSLYASFIFRKHSMQSEQQKHDLHYLLEIRRKSAFTSNFKLHSYKYSICIMYKKTHKYNAFHFDSQTLDIRIFGLKTAESGWKIKTFKKT